MNACAQVTSSFLYNPSTGNVPPLVGEYSHLNQPNQENLPLAFSERNLT